MEVPRNSLRLFDETLAAIRAAASYFDTTTGTLQVASHLSAFENYFNRLGEENPEDVDSLCQYLGTLLARLQNEWSTAEKRGASPQQVLLMINALLEQAEQAHVRGEAAGRRAHANRPSPTQHHEFESSDEDLEPPASVTRDWRDWTARRHKPYLERPLKDIQSAFVATTKVAQAERKDFTAAVHEAAGDIQRWSPRPEVTNGQYEKEQEAALDRLQALANELLTIRARGVSEGISPATQKLSDRLRRCLDAHRAGVLAEVTKANEIAKLRHKSQNQRTIDVPHSHAFELADRSQQASAGHAHANLSSGGPADASGTRKFREYDPANPHPKRKNPQNNLARAHIPHLSPRKFAMYFPERLSRI